MHLRVLLAVLYCFGYCLTIPSDDKKNGSVIIDRKEKEKTKVNPVMRTTKKPENFTCNTCEARTRCPENWTFWNGSCYKFYKNKATWDEARKSCQSYSYGKEIADLVTIKSKEENEFLKNENFVKFTFWIGLNDFLENKVFRWNNESIATAESVYTNWSEGEPNNHENKGEHCVEMYGSGGKKGSWNDAVCRKKNGYVCEIEREWKQTNLFEYGKDVEDISIRLNNGTVITNIKPSVIAMNGTLGLKHDNNISIKFNVPVSVSKLTLTTNPASPVKLIAWRFLEWDTLGDLKKPEYKTVVKYDRKTATTTATFICDNTFIGIREVLLTVKFNQKVQFTLNLFGFSKIGLLDKDCLYPVNCRKGVSKCETKISEIGKGFWRLEKGCANNCNSIKKCTMNYFDGKNNFNNNNNDNRRCGYCCDGEQCNNKTNWKDFTTAAVFKLTIHGRNGTYSQDMKNNASDAYRDIVKSVEKFPEYIRQIERATLVEIRTLENKTDLFGIFIIRLKFRMLGVYSEAKKAFLSSVLKMQLKNSNNYGYLNRPRKYRLQRIDWPNVKECPSEMWDKDVAKGRVRFPKTKAGETASHPCPQNPEQNCTRKCNLNGEWEAANMDRCKNLQGISKRLNDLAKKKINLENRADVSKELSNITSNPEEMKSTDITMATDVLVNLVKTTSSKSSSQEVAGFNENIMDTMDNMLQVDKTTLESSERIDKSATRFMKDAVEDFTDNLDCSWAPLSRSSLAAACTNGSQESYTFQASGTQYGISGIVKANTTADNTLVRITIPKEAVGTKKVSCNVFLDDKYFIEEGTENPVKSVVVAGRVVGASSQNLSKPVVLEFNMDPPAAENNSVEPKVVFWDEVSRKWEYGGGNVVSWDNKTGKLRAHFNHMTNFAVLFTPTASKIAHVALKWISILGCGLSLVGLILTIITYTMFQKVRKDDPGKMILCLSISLAVGNIVFLIGNHYNKNDIPCKVIAILLHYSFLSSFCWTAPFSYRMFRQLKSFQRGTGSIIKRSALFAWGFPFIVVLITACLMIKFSNIYRHNVLCWLDTIPFYAAFLGPVCVILVFNLGTLLFVIHISCQVARSKNAQLVGKVVWPEERKRQLRRTATTAAGLTFLLGLTWLFGLLAVTETYSVNFVIQVIFCIFNSLQGFFIFVFFCIMKQDVYKAWQRWLPCCPDPKTSTGASAAKAQSSSSGGFRQYFNGKKHSSQDTKNSYVLQNVSSSDCSSGSTSGHSTGGSTQLSSAGEGDTQKRLYAVPEYSTEVEPTAPVFIDPIYPQVAHLRVSDGDASPDDNEKAYTNPNFSI